MNPVLRTVAIVNSFVLASLVTVYAQKNASEPAFLRRGVVLVPSDLTWKDWPQRASKAGLTTIALHSTPSVIEQFIDSPDGPAFLETCAKLGLQIEYELHAVGELLPRDMFPREPDCFRMNEKGIRTADANLCVHSERALQIASASMLRLARKLKPSTRRYYFWGDDGAGWCHCPKCREYSDSEQALLLENHLLAALRTLDSRAQLAHLAYHNTIEAPRKVKPAPGVFLEFAPIHREYDKPLSEQYNGRDGLKLLEDNLKVFPPQSAQVLEYWLDVSRFSSWKRPAKQLPWRPDVMKADAQTYSRLGIRSATTFAVYIDAEYLRLYGEPVAIQDYGGILRSIPLPKSVGQ